MHLFYLPPLPLYFPAPSSLPPSPTASMKLPGKIFTFGRKSHAISKSEPPSFTSQASWYSASSSDEGFRTNNGVSTPTSVLREGDSHEHIDLKHVFEMIDGDGDGKIRKEDLAPLIRRIGADLMSPEEMEAMLSEVDADGDGFISLEEFRAIGEAFAPPTCDVELRRTFEFFDSDGDGRITAEELFHAFQTVGGSRCTLEECRGMIGAVGRNREGFVCFEDFGRMMELQTALGMENEKGKDSDYLQ